MRKENGIASSVISRSVFITLIFTVISSSIWYYRTDYIAKEQFYEGTQRAVERLAYTLRHPIWQFDTPQIESILKSYVKDPPVVGILVVFPIEGFKYQYGLINRNGVLTAITEEDLSEHLLYNGYYQTTESIMLDNDVVGDVYVWYSTSSLTELSRNNLVFSILTFGFGTLVLYIVLHRALITLVLSPLKLLQKMVESVETNKPNNLQIINGSKEFRGLTQALRNMLQDFNQQHQDLTLRLNEIAEVERELLYKSLVFSTVHDGIIIGSLDRIIIDWSNGAERILGFVKEEAVGKKVFDFIPYDYDPVEEIIDSVGSWNGNITVPRKNSQTITIELLVMPMLDHKKQRIAFLYIFQDITRQMMTDAEIRDLARFPEENPNPVMRIDSSMDVLYSNIASEELLRHWNLYETRHIPEHLQEPFQKAFVSRTIQMIDVECETKVFSLVIAPVKSSPYINVYGLDITERTNALKALQRSEERFKSAIDVAPFPIMLHAEGEVVTINKAWRELSGYTIDEIRTVEAWIDKAYRTSSHSPDEVQTIIENLYSIGEAVHEGVFQIATAFGGFRYWDFNTAPIGKIRDKKLVISIAADVTEQLAAEDRAIKLNHRVITALEDVNRLNDDETGGHIERLAEIAALIAKAYGCSDEEINSIYLYAPLHDVGKVGLPDALLKKPGKYTPEEFKDMQQHVLLGAQILGCPVAIDPDHCMHLCNNCGQCIDPVACHIAFYHHEKWDGSGYICHTKGEQIPLPARIVTIADVWDALISKRVYKPKFSEDKALKIMKDGSGTHFDPELLTVFLDVLPDIRKIKHSENKTSEIIRLATTHPIKIS